MCDEDTARAALRAIGIPFPSQALIQSWIQANRADREFRRQESAPPTLRSPATAQSADRKVQHRRGYSKSRLEPSLREQGKLQRQHERRKPGRPRIVASWFPAVAQSMADGTPLRDALRLNGITLEKRQIRALYRNEEFRRLYQEERHRYLRSLRRDTRQTTLRK
jgi:hypothetical protein